METALTPVVGLYTLNSDANNPCNSKHLQQAP